ncbi:trypsin-like serine peptidase [Streptosporangium sp. OZ121]|uniref:trypsin-like serine peptidase n=1 Tax=Streptosporangium sp. OZ121 TaxID=3444183 RepID=UPI003F7982A1
MSPPTIQLEPLVSWPRTMTVGQEYLVTVDLRLARPGDEWPYREEEFAFGCMLDGGERIAVESVDDVSVILHRFGGTYGPARFVVTARGETGDHELRLSLSTQRGATVRTDTLPVRITALASDEEDRRVDRQAISGGPGPGTPSRRERTWVAAIHRGDDPRPVGAGVLVGENRLLTCAHVVATGHRSTDRLWVTFPWSNTPTRRHGALVVSVAGTSDAVSETSPGDPAFLMLADPPSPEVVAAPLRLEEVDDLVGRRWLVEGPADAEGRSVIVRGVMDPAPAHGCVTLTTDPGHRLDPGLSGAAVWSPGYGAVIGMVTNVGGPGGGVAITIREVNALFPGQLPEAPGGRPGGQGWENGPNRGGRLADVREPVVSYPDVGVPPLVDADFLDEVANYLDEDADLLDETAGRPAPVLRERADVIFAIEMSGGHEAVQRRRQLASNTIEQLAVTYPGEVNVAVIGYTYHDYKRRGDGRRPVVTGSWLEPAEDALASLAGLESTSSVFPGAAPLEDALHYIDQRLPLGEQDRPVVLLVIARQPPHPARASRDAALPCPNRYDHRKLTDRLAERGVRLMAVTDDVPRRVSPQLRRIGADHSVELRRADPAALVDAMAIRHGTPAGRPTRRITTDPDPAPETGQIVRRIGLLGATGSGKSAFLGALNVAVLRQNSGLSVLGADSASAARLVELTDILVREHRLPPASADLDDIEVTIRARRLSRGFWGMGRRETGVVLHLGSMATSGTPRESMARWLAACDDLIYLFDPLRESRWDDASRFFLSTLPRLGLPLDEAGRLPHRLAVCVTKFDDFKVLETAKRLRLLTTDPEDPFGFPRVADEDAQELFRKLCGWSADGSGVLPNVLERLFHEHRTRYFVTSSIGFYIDPRERLFTMDDYQNLIPVTSGPAGGQPAPSSESGTAPGREVRIRGEVHPIDVEKPFLWLAQP